MTRPTPEELALDLAKHAANLEPLCTRDGVNTLYGPRGWYSMGHHLAAIHRALWAEAELARLQGECDALRDRLEEWSR